MATRALRLSLALSLAPALLLSSVGTARADGASPALVSRGELRAAKAGFRRTVRSDPKLALEHGWALSRAVARSFLRGGLLGGVAGFTLSGLRAQSLTQLLLGAGAGATIGTAFQYTKHARRDARTQTAERAIARGLMTRETAAHYAALDLIHP